MVKLDIILGFEPGVPGSSPGEGTKIMKKIFFAIIIFSILVLPFAVNAADGLCNDGQGGIVPCGNTEGCPCKLGHFFVMLNSIYAFIVKTIAAPLATIAIVVGAVMMIFSAGNPSTFQRGRQIIIYAIVGLVLAFASMIIIKAILSAMGYKYINTLN